MFHDFLHLIQCKVQKIRETGELGDVVRVWTIRAGMFALGIIALAKCMFTYVPEALSVSSTINGRELPIYCVETEEKKVALSFDAAWGNVTLR